MLAATQAELTETSAGFHQSSVSGDSQRVELVALRAQNEALKGQIDSFEKETKELRERLASKTGEVEMSSQLLGEERAKAEQLGSRVGELDRQIIVQTTESEVLTRRVQELTARLDEQGRFLADREFTSDRLRSDAATAQKTEADVRAELANAETRHLAATEAVRAEKAQVEDQLKQSHEERAKLQRDIAAMKRDAETAWANERMENAVLRERINDVAAEVARLTATLEGPESPIDTILRADAGRPAMAPGATNGSGTPSIAPAGPSRRAPSPTASAPCKASPRARSAAERRLKQGVADHGLGRQAQIDVRDVQRGRPATRAIARLTWPLDLAA